MERFEDISSLLIAPGTRLVMPSEQSEDYLTGLKYTGEFDNFRTVASSKVVAPHTEFLTTYARVFANDIAEPFMKNEKLRFPVGAVIVRERLKNPSDHRPEILSVMVRREKGFSPLTNDWGFALIDTATSKITSGNASQSCIECHSSVRNADFVFKTYLP